MRSVQGRRERCIWSGGAGSSILPWFGAVVAVASCLGAQDRADSVSWGLLDAASFRLEFEVLSRSPHCMGVCYVGSDEGSHFFLGRSIGFDGLQRWQVPRDGLRVDDAFDFTTDPRRWRNISDHDVRADVVARFASRDDVPWALLGRRVEVCKARALTPLVDSKRVDTRSRRVVLETNRRMLARMVADLEVGASLYPACFALGHAVETARRDCENALRSPVLVRSSMREMMEEDLVLWSRLGICAKNLGVRSARWLPDTCFDELRERGRLDAHRVVYGRFLACCPGREEQAVDWLGTCLGHGEDDEVRRLQAWALTWLGDVDAADEALQGCDTPGATALREAVQRHRGEIGVRSRFLDPKR